MSTADVQRQHNFLNMLVLVGAGASYDCDDVDGRSVSGGDRMPLVGNLFDHTERLNDYIPVRAMAGDIRREIRADDPAGSVETYLRRITHEGKPFQKERARLIPLYYGGGQTV